MVAFADQRHVQLYNNSGTVQLVADLAGVFTVVDSAPCTTDCLYAWGYNSHRMLGTAGGTGVERTPTPVVALSGVRAVEGGEKNSYALREDGTVWAWGGNAYGQLGNGWSVDWVDDRGYGGSAVPVPVVGLTDVIAIAAEGPSAYALRADGTVWAWGHNIFGQLGTALGNFLSAPVQVTGLTDVVAIAAGWRTGYAVRADGTVWSWGFRGAVGTGEPCCDLDVPARILGLTDVTEIASGLFNGYALRADGTVWSWGANYSGHHARGR